MSPAPSSPSASTHRPPTTCPVCAGRLHVTQLGCDACGTGISGSFATCDFCALDAGQLDLLRVFLGSRGNLREVEKHLGVSYPTARARFDEVLKALGIPVREAAPAPLPDPSEDDARRETLAALARGELDVSEARRRLT